MKNKEFHKLLKKNRSSSGFTLTELLVGLIMGTIVVGGLGFGLVSLLRNTQTQTAFTGARNESARALDFVSDEVKRAVAIQADATNATGFSPAGKTVVFALNIPQVNTSATLGSDGDATTPERIVYYLQANTGTNWQGPQVLYRYGPPLNTDGSYDTGDWDEEALIDGINDTPLVASAIQCGAGQDTSPANPTGFYVCIQDDDLDGVTEDGATDTNGDGVVDADDSTDDTDDIGISAQLYLTSGVDIGRRDGSDNKILQTYTANTQVVARARVAPDDNSENFAAYSASLTSFTGQYGVDGCWKVRSDFGKGRNPSFDPTLASPHPDALEDIYTWIHEDNRQPQPLDIDTTKPFTMVASAFAKQDPNGAGFDKCIARGNSFKQKLVSIDNGGNNAVYSNVDGDGKDIAAGDSKVPVNGTEEIHTYDQKIWHTIEFPQKGDNNSEITQKRDTFNGNETENSDVKGDGTVYVFRSDSIVPDVGGYEHPDGNQPSLREYLQDPNQDGNTGDAFVNADGTFLPGKLDSDQRLIAFEIGQDDSTLNGNPNPGFDLQDNLFLITSEAFEAKSDN